MQIILTLKRTYNKINYTSALSILFIHKAKCFDLAVGHLQAHIADTSLVQCAHWDPNMFIKTLTIKMYTCTAPLDFGS